MKTILVSLISDQTIPNILVAAHVKPDIYWFISTTRMEKDRKIECILNTLKLKGLLHSFDNIKKAVVDQDSLSDCLTKIEGLLDDIDMEVEYVINITGGNKVMAFAAYEIFREIGQKVIIGYIPLRKNEFVQIYPRKKPVKIFNIGERLNLEEYLNSYGFRIQNRDKLPAIISKVQSRRDTSKWILDNYEQLKGFLGFLYKQLGDKRRRLQYRLSATFDRPLSRIEKEMAAMHKFQIHGQAISKDLTKDEITFLTGGWFEEYVFSTIHDSYEKGTVDDVMKGVVIESLSGSTNELDIAFMKDNVLHHIECKTLGEGDKEKNIIRDEVYKRGAISTLLGVVDKSIYTTHNQINEPILKRARDFGVNVLSINEVRESGNRLVNKSNGS